MLMNSNIYFSHTFRTNIMDRKKFTQKKYHGQTRSGSASIPHHHGSVTLLIPILFFSFFIPLSLSVSLFFSSYLVFLSSRALFLSLKQTEQPATEAPTRIGRVDSSSEHFQVLVRQSHFAPIFADFSSSRFSH